MSETVTQIGGQRARHIAAAVHQNPALSIDGLSERFFALLFSGLVYPQIWEDPEVDMAAMELREGHRIITIASGGCNILSYLTRSPASIDAVDLNAAHVALNKLKLTAARALPSGADFRRFFAETNNGHNADAYDRFIAPVLDAESRAYWGKRRWTGKRRIDAFNGNFYHRGLLGACIALGHRVAKLHGIDPSAITRSKSIADQRRFFREELEPLFSKPLIRLVTRSRASLFGLGIPPAQYDELITAGDGTMASVLKRRVEKLACDFPLKDNYFAWQAFGRRYPEQGEGALPLYLEAGNFDTVRAYAGRVRIRRENIVDRLRLKPAGSLDRYILLDAQDWMTPAQLDTLWAEITRTAAPEARVIFRTAAEASPLPGRVSDSVLSAWTYHEDASAEYTADDRSAIYGAFHLYEKRA